MDSRLRVVSPRDAMPRNLAAIFLSPDFHWSRAVVILNLLRSTFKGDWWVVEKLAELCVSPRTLPHIQVEVDAEEVEDVRVAVRNEI